MDKPRMEDLVAEHCDHFVSYLREGVGYMNNAEEGDRGRERERAHISTAESHFSNGFVVSCFASIYPLCRQHSLEANTFTVLHLSLASLAH